MVPRDYGYALEALKAGKRAAREGWNGRGMWLALVTDGTAQVRINPSVVEDIDLQPFIVMFTAQHNYVPWVASQADALADDWRVVE